jgi:hypothetical protein
MINKNLILLITLGILLIGSVSAVGETSYCCEKTKDGAWCQNAPEGKCDESFRVAPTSCEATSYCKLGCCYDSQEGVCIKNTPQKVCQEQGGVWSEKADCDIGQCELGCCLIGNQAAFVTQTRCKRLSSLYGLEINFRNDISSEIECIASATSDVKGACVFERDFERTCLLTTQGECKEMESEERNVSFHEGYLCSAEVLGTNCGPTEETTCTNEGDGVYFVDSCGNLANIYDSSKINDKNYWSEIKQESESCNPGVSNADSKTCGNCDYFLGSTCGSYKRGEDNKPAYGDYICKDLSCEYQGESYEHGETWCINNDENGENLPGSRHFRLVCYNGEVTVEPCADFRQEICMETDIEDFRVASCVANKWQDCTSIDNKDDCENPDQRDCKWINQGSVCVPLYPPGFDFWQEETDAESICSLGDVECTVTYEKGLLGGKECVDNCQCLSSLWREKMKEVCYSLGDCGESINYIGVEGES